jgi:glycosyltransferase involved in cell wall biosynthesis
MAPKGSPDLSVVIMTPDSFETIRKTLEAIRQQTVKNRIELIIVAPENADVNPDLSVIGQFYGYRLIKIISFRSLGTAKAEGIRAASAPVIALIEEHVYPDPGWAEALISAHQAKWSVIGPVVRNAEPHTLMSWADFIITYGQWMEPQSGGITSALPGHNSSYKRSVLMDYEDALGEKLEVEAALHDELQHQGHLLYIEPNAVIYHLGYHKLFASLPVQFHIGRLYATGRIMTWPLIRRLLYFAASPLIPLVRLFRLTRRLIQSGSQRRCPYLALVFTLPGLISSALGEMAGYAAGPGDSKAKIIRHEFHRDQH